jgi:hypothetical protein
MFELWIPLFKSNSRILKIGSNFSVTASMDSDNLNSVARMNLITRFDLIDALIINLLFRFNNTTQLRPLYVPAGRIF